MRKYRPSAIITLLFSSALMLGASGCKYFNGEPDPEELRNLVKANILTQMKNATGDNPILNALNKITGANQITFNKIEKISCIPVKEKITSCDVFIDYQIGQPDNLENKSEDNNPFKVSQKIQKTITLQFYKSDTGWENLYQ